MSNEEVYESVKTLLDDGHNCLSDKLDKLNEGLVEINKMQIQCIEICDRILNNTVHWSNG